MGGWRALVASANRLADLADDPVFSLERALTAVSLLEKANVISFSQTYRVMVVSRHLEINSALMSSIHICSCVCASSRSISCALVNTACLIRSALSLVKER